MGPLSLDRFAVTRRSLIAALAIAPQLRAQSIDQLQWRELADVWNPFAEKLNSGVFDLKLWKKVLQKIHSIEGKSSCKEK